MAARATQGFTVLEMMVVLLIISLALMLGFESLGQWQRAEAALERVSTTTRARALTTQWWASSIRGLTPVDDQPFVGTPERLSGFSLAPVFASQGAMTMMEWAIADDPELGLSLHLTENGQTHVLPLVDGKEAEFHYIDEDGKVSDRWPPLALGLEPKDLPAYVELRVRNEAGDEHAWLSHVIGPLEPWYKPYKIEDE